MNNLDNHIYTPYQEELESVRSKFIEMAGLVEAQLLDSVKAIDALDAELAEAVLVKEALIDKMEVVLEQDCTQIIALRAPTASDLRSVLGTIRCVGELERVGDEAKKIANMTIKLENESEGVKGYKEIRHLSKGVTKMLREAIDSFARMDADGALEILEQDDEIDSDYASAIRELITYMMEDPRSISRSINILWVLRSLERVGDHAKNICEAIVYIVRGKDIRHGNIANLSD